MQSTVGATTVPAYSAARRAWVVGVMCLAVMLVISSMSSLYGAIADLAVDTGATQKELTWIIDSYTLVFACALLPAGALGDRYGRRGVLMLGTVVFGISTIASLLDDSPTWIIACRALTGLGAALVTPSTLSLITTVYSAEERGKAVGLWSASTVLGGAIGMLYGGTLLEFYSWQSIFVVATIAAGTVFLLSFTVPGSKDPDQPGVDWAGAVVGSAAVGIFVYGMIEAPDHGWTSTVFLGCMAASLAFGILFVFVEMHRPHPMLDVRLLANRTFGSGALMLTMMMVAGFGYYFLIMQFNLFVEGHSALIAAALITPMAITLIPLSIAAPPLTERIGMKAVCSFGLAASAAAYFLLLLVDLDSGPGIYWLTILLLGIGYGVTMAAGTHAIVNNVPDSKQGVASAVNNATREVGAAIGVAFAGSLSTSGYKSAMEGPTQGLPEPVREVANESVGGALQIAQLSGPQGEGLAGAAKSAFVQGMHDGYFGIAVLMIGTLVLILWWAPGPRGSVAVFERHRAQILTGLVRAPDRRPLAGARVSVVDLEGRQVGRDHTGADGRYEILDVPSGGRYLVVCAADSLAPRAAVVQLNGSPIDHDVLMGDPARLHGMVRADGVGVADTTVTVLDGQGLVLTTVTTDPGGRYHVDDVAAGPVTLAVVGSRWQPMAVSVEVPSGGDLLRDLDLAPKRELSGVVRSAASGAPVPDASVVLTDDHGVQVASTRSRPDGTFQLDGVVEGGYTLTTAVVRSRRTAVSIPADGAVDVVVDLAD